MTGSNSLILNQTESVSVTRGNTEDQKWRVHNKHASKTVGCSSALSWDVKICQGCNCIEHISLDISHDMLGDASKCAQWFRIMDATFRIYFAQIRGELLSQKIACCLRKKNPSDAAGMSSRLAGVLCNNEDLPEDDSSNEDESSNNPGYGGTMPAMPTTP